MEKSQDNVTENGDTPSTVIKASQQVNYPSKSKAYLKRKSKARKSTSAVSISTDFSISSKKTKIDKQNLRKKKDFTFQNGKLVFPNYTAITLLKISTPTSTQSNMT